MADRLYRFDEFEADEARFELRRAGARVDLQPKALDFLFCLLRHRDRIVSKDELLEGLWPDTVVTDASLSKAARLARQALGDGGRAPVYIATVRGRGFRFVAEADETRSQPRRARDRDYSGDGEPGPAAALAAEAEGGFVGRERVLAAIAAATADAADERGRFILLSGEAGMGKTRTAFEAAARTTKKGARVLIGWCHEGGGAPALWPWIQLLRQLLSDRNVAQLAAGLGDGLDDLAPFVTALGKHQERRHRDELEPDEARFRLFETVTELLKRAAREQTHLLVLDDFHLADRGSLSMLAFLSRSLPQSRLAVLITYRSDELPAGHTLLDLVRRPDCVAIPLSGLDREEVRRLVELEAGKKIDEDIVQLIHGRTDGNPFFVKELAHGLATCDSSDRAALADLPLPAGVREVLRQRLERLSEECRRMLTAGAAIGREFEVATVGRATGHAPEHALTLLDEARRAKLIRQVGGKQRLSHALVREVLLEDLGGAERTALHRRIGEALLAQHGPDDDSHLGEIAFHLCEGAPSGEAEQAVAYARRAGDRAAELLAYDEAAKHYRRALELDSFTAADRRRTCELLLALGEAQVACGQPREGRNALREAAEIARQLGLAQHLARAALAAGGLLLSTEPGVDDPELVGLLEEALEDLPDEDSPLRVSIQTRLAIALAWSSTSERSTQDLIDQAVEGARRVDDPVALGHAIYAHRWRLVRLDLEPDDLDARRADSDELVRIGRRARHRGIELAGRSCRFIDLVESGRIPEADRELAAYGRLAAAVRVPRYRWRTSVYRAMRMLLDGRFSDAEALAQAAFAEEQRFSPTDVGSVFGAQLAAVRHEQGRFAELEPALTALVERLPALVVWRAALVLLRAEDGREADARDGFEALAADDFHAARHDPMRLATLAFLSETCALLGDSRRAGMLYELLRPYAPRFVMVGAGVVCFGAVDRYLGILATTRGDRERAVRHFEAAIQTEARAGARPWLAWSEYDLARLLAQREQRHDRQRAHEHLQHAEQSANALGMVRLGEYVAELARVLERGVRGRGRARLVGL